MPQQPEKAQQQDRSRQDIPYANRSNPANQASPTSLKDEEERKKQAAKNRTGGMESASGSQNARKSNPFAQNRESGVDE